MNLEGRDNDFVRDEKIFTYKFTRRFWKIFKVNTEITFHSEIHDKILTIVTYCNLNFWQRHRLTWAFGNHWFQQEKNLMWMATIIVSITALFIAFFD